MKCWPCWLLLGTFLTPFAVIGFRIWRRTRPGQPWWDDEAE